MSIDDKLKELDISLPQPPRRAGVYVQSKPFAPNMVYVSGCGPDLNGECVLKGRLGAEIDVTTGQHAAKCCMLNALAILKRDLGSLDRIKSFVKMLAFVSSDLRFFEQTVVANGASELLSEVFGEAIGCPARSAIGVNVLPGNIPVEIELLVELNDEKA